MTNLLFIVNINGQQLRANWFDGLIQNPTTPAELKESNSIVAKAFAPLIIQMTSAFPVDSEDGLADIPVRVNYDGNWDHLDNWDNVSQISGEGGYPAVYYAVLWTEGYWIITYSLYYPRDYANDGVLCNVDEHEGDMPNVLVIVKRLTDEDPTFGLSGFTTPHHGENDIVNCIDVVNAVNAIDGAICYGYDLGDNEPLPPFNLGEHAKIFVSAGSHAIYDDATSALEDRGRFAGQPIQNSCNPLVSLVIGYLPEGGPPERLIDEDNNPVIDGSLCNANIADRFGRYQLIDIFDSLWPERNTLGLFSPSTSYTDQTFLCDNGQCESKAATAPWSSSIGMNPLTWIHDNVGGFNCECYDSAAEAASAGCIEVDFTDCLYEHNPYLCELYKITMPQDFNYNGQTVLNPHEVNGNVVVNFRLNALGIIPANTPVIWDWDLPAGFTNIVNCDGCNEKLNEITLTIEDATIAEVLANAEEITVTATADFVECGSITKKFTFKVELDKILSPSSGCDKLIFEIKDEYHIEGNIYEWAFPLYDDLAIVKNSGRKVEFDTKNVIDNTSDATNPDKMLDWNLKVSNPSANTRIIELDGGIKIPECDFTSFTRLSVALYPNPSTNEISVNFKGLGAERGFGNGHC